MLKYSAKNLTNFGMLEPESHPSSPLRLHRSPLQARATTSIRKLNECKHFHYEYVELGPILVELKTNLNIANGNDAKDTVNFLWTFEIESNSNRWLIHRTFNELSEFDCQLHRCVFDRRFSRLVELSQFFLPDPALPSTSDDNTVPNLYAELSKYANRLSQLTGSLITCYPVLKFLELDSRGNHFVPIEQTQINTPAVVSAFVVKDYVGTQPDELTLKVGDIISVVEMKYTGQSETNFWKGKLTVSRSISNPTLNDDRILEAHNFAVGYFPSNCVELFGDKPLTVMEKETNKGISTNTTKWHRHRSLLRSFFRSTAKVNSTANENGKVFGVDLTEYLSKSQLSVPLVVTKCIECIETHGVVTGIYRQCGIQSNIRQLRLEFDSGIVPNFSNSSILQDIHCVSSLLKQYFRQLPNPLFTFELYLSLLEAFGSRPLEKISNVREVIKRLPPAHYRNPPSLDTTSMILTGINVHKNLCNFLIVHAYSIFKDIPETFDTSLMLPDIDASSDDLKAELDSETQLAGDRNCVEVNGGPATLPKVFHTVLHRSSLTDASADVPTVKLRKKVFRNSIMESSLVGFLHRRGIIMNNNNNGNERNNERCQQKRKWSNLSDPSHKRSEMRRSESILANLAKNVEDFRDSIVRTVQNRVRSVRRGHKSRKNSCLETTSVIERVDSLKLANERFERFSSVDFTTSPKFMSKSMEGHLYEQIDERMFEPIDRQSPKMLQYSNVEEIPKTPCSIKSLKHETIKPPITVTPSPIMRRRRVMFESNSPTREIIYETEHSSKDPELSTTDASSAESLPLDVSRYDNVSPQKSIDMEENDKQPRENSTPLSLYEDPNLSSISKMPKINPQLDIYYF